MATIDEAVKGHVRGIPERVEQRAADALRKLDTAQGYKNANPKFAKQLTQEAEQALGRCVEDAQKFADALARSPKAPKPTGNTRSDLVTLRAWAKRAIARRGKLMGKKRPPPAWYQQAYQLRAVMPGPQSQLAVLLSKKLGRRITQQTFGVAVKRWEEYQITTGVNVPSVLARKGRTRITRLVEQTLQRVLRDQGNEINHDEE